MRPTREDVTASDGAPGDPTGLAEAAVRLAEIDTLYGDLYLQRGRELLAARMTRADYDLVTQLQDELVRLPGQIHDALESENWATVGALSTRVRYLERTLAEEGPQQRLGATLYGPWSLHVDPFSRSLQRLSAFPGASEDARRRGIALLELLLAADPVLRDFYAARLQALRALALSPAEAAPSTTDRLRRDAERALAEGRFEELARLSDALRARPDDASAADEARPARPSVDLTYAFSPDVVDRAARLGLVPERAPSIRDELAPVRRLLAQPAFDETGHLVGDPIRLPLPLPRDAPQARRDRVELLATRAVVSSAGLRMLSPLQDEDVLVEGFDDPPAGEEPPPTPLLGALRLRRRRGLSRRRLEDALGDHGLAVMGDLGLDPRRFRLVCIPPDLHWRLGERRGWGRQASWTHLDGYMLIPGGTFLALAGGDVRFGGVFDLVAVSRDNDSEHLFARLCVVQRDRMRAG